jgi:hypothetical protein
MTINAELVQIFPIETRGEYQFRKVWVKTNDKEYPQTLELELSKSLIDKINEIAHEGNSYKIDLNLKGRKSDRDGNVRVFNIIQAWQFTKLDS